MNIDAALIVFGSFARFKIDGESDLDLLAISKEKFRLPSHLLPYKLHQISMSEEDFINAVNNKETLIKEVQNNHIILNNHSHYVNVIWSYYAKQ